MGSGRKVSDFPGHQHELSRQAVQTSTGSGLTSVETMAQVGFKLPIQEHRQENCVASTAVQC